MKKKKKGSIKKRISLLPEEFLLMGRTATSTHLTAISKKRKNF
jgi:hypothetical protein